MNWAHDETNLGCDESISGRDETISRCDEMIDKPIPRVDATSRRDGPTTQMINFVLDLTPYKELPYVTTVGGRACTIQLQYE